MKTKFTGTKNYLLPLLAILIIFNSCKKDRKADEIIKPDLVFTALTNTGQLLTYNAKDITSSTGTISISGLQSGETLLAIDYRPATGQLYGLGSTNRIYVISAVGKATAIGASAFSPALSGNIVGFDFNPTVDRIRVVTSTGQNLRINPETGAVLAVDGSINGAASAAISGAAYINNKAGASTTTLFDIDVATKKLYKQDPPNNGSLVEVGSLNIMETGSESAFDISPAGIALASLSSGSTSSLYQVNLETGAATNLGKFTNNIIGLAIPTEPVAYAVDESNNLIIFNPVKTEQISKPITGLQTAETIHGIDFRPANGQLYALGSSSRLYTINLSSGAATPVGITPLLPILSGTSFGFDFNPQVDRIRVVSNIGQNLRLDPNTGLVVATDGSLNPGSPTISGSAYTNNFPGTLTTVLFGIDYSTDKLYRQDPPNSGTLVEIGALGVNTDAFSGFDIGGTSGTAYAMLTSGTTTRLYTINLTTGMATAGIEFNRQVKGFAIGLGF